MSSDIATLPRLTAEDEVGYRLSHRTGEPRRPVVLLLAVGLCWMSVLVTIGAFAWWWWLSAHLSEFHSSTRLLAWTQPDPVSALAIVMVILVALIGLLMVVAAGLCGYNAWAGQRWVRTAGLICLAVTGLSFLLNWWFSAAMIPLACAIVLLWLPPVKTFLVGMEVFRAEKVVVVPTRGIKYGPQPLIGSRY